MVYLSGIKRTTPHLILRALPPSQDVAAGEGTGKPGREQPTQLGISVSQKVSKRAVIRNRIKRQIRAALRQFIPCLPLGWQIVIIVKPNATQCDYEDFLRELEQLLMNAEVIDGHSRRDLL